MRNCQLAMLHAELPKSAVSLASEIRASFQNVAPEQDAFQEQ
jgi:hypothetical protein